MFFENKANGEDKQQEEHSSYKRKSMQKQTLTRGAGQPQHHGRVQRGGGWGGHGAAGEGPLDETRAPSLHTLSPQSGQITTVPEAKTRCLRLEARRTR